MLMIIIFQNMSNYTKRHRQKYNYFLSNTNLATHSKSQNK